MPLSINDPEADRLARALAKETGETITEAVKAALAEWLARMRQRYRGRRLAGDLDEIASGSIPTIRTRIAGPNHK